ncbi:DUF6493 family protein [Microlunatus ginsengisoli]|uniref:DUF6493 domain-containing protein n=1 Tax=Microlunatus ginsengisoli TaxID=363863 RepID=A0ABP7A5L2_9ACTN
MTTVLDGDLRWADLAPADPEVVGGLVTAAAEKAVAQTPTPAWRRGSAAFRGMGVGLRAAASGAASDSRIALLPAWLSEAVGRRISDFRGLGVDAAIQVRALERKGLLILPRQAEYALGMLDLPAEWWRVGDPVEDPNEWFVADPTLLPAMVRRLLAEERDRRVRPQDVGQSGCWQPRLVEVANRSAAGRVQLLTCCVAELGHEPDRYRTAWLTALWDRAEPGVAEVAAQQRALFRLLAASSAPGTAFALARLQQLSRAELLDDDACARALANGLPSMGNTSARLAVKILQAIHRRSSTADVEAAATAALSHPDVEVQSDAALILVQAGRFDVVARVLDGVEPSVRHEVGMDTGQPPAVAFHLHPHPHRHLSVRERWSAQRKWFRPVSPGVLGALLTERGERARAATYEEPGRKDAAVWWAIKEAVSAAVGGATVDRETTTIPSWVATALRRQIADHEFSRAADFATIRVIERSGLVELDVDDAYVSTMIVALVSVWSDETMVRATPVAWLRDDPELIDRALWRLFDTEGQGSISLTYADRWSDDAWQGAVAALVDSGRLERGAVVDAALGTLGRDWSAFRLQWFVRLLEALQPTVEELADRQAALRRLLRSEHSVVVSAVLRWFALLSRAGRLEDQETAARLADVMGSSVKGHPLAALHLLQSIRGRTAAADVRPAGRAALRHPHPDVQRKAAGLLRAVGDDSALILADELDPAVRHELGLNVAPALRATPGQPVVDAAPEIVPVTPADLPDRLAAVMEDASDPIELELVLDRLAQTGDLSVLAPLLKRARSKVRSGQGDYDGDAWLGGELARLVAAGADGFGSLVEPKDQVAHFLFARLDHVAGVLTGRLEPEPPIATPDDADGWVSAEALVERIRAAGASVGRIDVIAALLRLHPAGREDALRRADLPGELGAVVRHALGDSGAAASDVVDQGLWVAASRARSPFEADPVLVAAGLDRPGQGRPLRADLRLYEHADRFDRYWESEVVVRGARRRRQAPDQPTAVRSVDSRDRRQINEVTWVPWTASVWPHDADHFLVGSLDHIRAGISFGWPGSTGGLRSLLRHPGRIGPLGAAAVAMGLSAHALDDRVLAVDIFIHATASRRLGAERVGDAMAATSGPCVGIRWAESLRSAASGGAGEAVVDTLTRLVPQLPPGYPGLYALLDVLLQERLRLGGGVDDTVLRERLATLTGSSKAARSARALLAL